MGRAEHDRPQIIDEEINTHKWSWTEGGRTWRAHVPLQQGVRLLLKGPDEEKVDPRPLGVGGGCGGYLVSPLSYESGGHLN